MSRRVIANGTVEYVDLYRWLLNWVHLKSPKFCKWTPSHDHVHASNTRASSQSQAHAHKRERGLFYSFCLLFDHLALASPFAQHGPPIIVARLLNFTPELLIYLAFYGKKLGHCVPPPFQRLTYNFIWKVLTNTLL